MIRNERPEEEQNPTLIRELATIRFNYYLTTFKEVFNDVIDERKRLCTEARQRDGSGNLLGNEKSRFFSPHQSVIQMKTDDLRKSTSVAVLNSHFGDRYFNNGKKSNKLDGVNKKDFTGSVLSSGSVGSLPYKTITLTENDQKQIDMMRVRNERFTNKLICD